MEVGKQYRFSNTMVDGDDKRKIEISIEKWKINVERVVTSVNGVDGFQPQLECNRKPCL